MELTLGEDVPRDVGEGTFLMYKAMMQDLAKTDKKYADKIKLLNIFFIMYLNSIAAEQTQLQMSLLGSIFEFVRRELFPHESKALQTNGDIDLSVPLQPYKKGLLKAKK